MPFMYNADGTLPSDYDRLVEGLKKNMLRSLRSSRHVAVGSFLVQHSPDIGIQQRGKLFVTVSVERV